MKNKAILLILFSSLLSLRGFGQSVAAQVSSKRVQVGVPFDFAIVISGAASNLTQPNFRDFDIISGPNQSNNVQYVNGVMSQQMIFSYVLVARKEGKFTIGAATAVVDGQRLDTKPIVIEAVKGAAGSQGNAEAEARAAANDIYIKTTVSKNKIYIGEQITIIQKVYSRQQIIGYQKSVQPSYDGFYSQPQESPTKGQLLMENVDGVNYFSHEVLRTLATANKPGRITLSPMEADVIIRRQTTTKPRNVFEQFFGAAGYEDVPVHASSRPITVEVLPLPEEGKPASFNGAVGSFNSRVELTRNKLKANEALNLKMTITGKGNIKLITAPVLELPEGIEVYEPKVSEGANSKTFDYLIIPRQEGEYEFKNLEFSYFNLDTKKYVTLPSPDLRITVLPGDANSQGAQVYSPHSQVKETENDIRYIKKGEFLLKKRDEEFFNSLTHLLLICGPPFLLLVALVVRRKHIANNSNVVLVKERQAAKTARRQLVKAEKLMQANKKDEFYMEILTATNNYLSHKLHIPSSDLSKETISREMNRRQIEPGLLARLLDFLNTCEYARYAPGAVSGDLKMVYKDTVGLISAIEEQSNRKTA